MQFFSRFNRYTLLALALVGTSAPAAHAVSTVVPQISIKDGHTKEGNSGRTPMAFEVGLTKTPTSEVSVSYRTFGRTASSSDFANTSGTLTFAPGVKTMAIVVFVNGDTKAEENETFLVKLTGPKGATLRNDEATGTIINDDGDVKSKPGGGKIAFTSYDQNYGINIMNADGTNRTRITTDYNDSSATWSPDGKKIAFDGSFEFNGSQARGLAVVDADGKNRTELTGDVFRYSGSRPSWSGDSKGLLYSNYGGTGIMLAPIDGSTPKRLTTGSYDISPSASVTGNKIVFSGYDSKTNHFQIFSVNAQGGSRTQLTSDTDADDYSPQISADGKTIIFQKMTSQSTTQDWAMTGEGGNQRLLIEVLNTDASAPKISDDGSKGVITVNFDGVVTIYVIDIKKGVVKETVTGRVPEFSPDGKTIVFDRPVGDSAYGVFTMSSDGTGSKELTGVNDFNFLPDIASGSVPAPSTSSSGAAATVKAGVPAPSGAKS